MAESLITLKAPREIALMREAGRVVAEAHRVVSEAIRPGVTTGELDRLIDDFVRSRGGVPSFKGYHGFPAASCISINEQLVHGIPGSRTLEQGDIVSIDIGVILDGYHGDSAWSYGVGEISPTARRLFEVTEAALMAGIARAIPGNRLGDVGHAIQRVVETGGFHIVREYVGHGIGRDMHEAPQIPNYGEPGFGTRLRPGMTLAIEPMVQTGTWRTETLDDGWTVISADRSLAAHFEHTVAIGDDGAEILTAL